MEFGIALDCIQAIQIEALSGFQKIRPWYISLLIVLQ